AERERAEPTWGDPSYRVLPSSLAGATVGMTHLHVNNDDVLEDPEIALPAAGLAALVASGRAGAVADRHYSVMGYQEAGLAGWRTQTGPAIAGHLRDDRADGLILAPV